MEDIESTDEDDADGDEDGDTCDCVVVSRAGFITALVLEDSSLSVSENPYNFSTLNIFRDLS